MVPGNEHPAPNGRAGWPPGHPGGARVDWRDASRGRSACSSVKNYRSLVVYRCLKSLKTLAPYKRGHLRVSDAPNGSELNSVAMRYTLVFLLGAMLSLAMASTRFLPPAQGACKSGGSWHRPGDKPTTAAGFRACRDQCAQQGYQHFGGECPMGAGGNFHCQCSHTILGSIQPVNTNTCLRSVGHCIGSNGLILTLTP